MREKEMDGKTSNIVNNGTQTMEVNTRAGDE